MNEPEASTSAVFIGIGANLGSVRENFARAVRSIEKCARLVAVSSLYESEPVGLEDQPKFTNAVVKVETELSPFELLDCLKAIEKEIGRKKNGQVGAEGNRSRHHLLRRPGNSHRFSRHPTPESARKKVCP